MQNDNHWVTRLEEGILSLLLAAMTLLIVAQVAARYLFNASMVWVLEATTVLFAWMVLLGASYGVKVGAHIGVDLAVQFLPKMWQRAAAVFAALLSALYALILLDASPLAVFGDGLNARGGAVEYVVKIRKFGIEMEDLPIPQWLAYVVLPFGLALFVFRCLQAAWLILRGKRGTMIAVHHGEDAAAADAPPAAK